MLRWTVASLPPLLELAISFRVAAASGDTSPRFYSCLPLKKGSPCLRTVVSGGHSLLCLLVRVKVVLFQVNYRDGHSCSLSASGAYRFCDVSNEIDSHIIRLTGTRLLCCRPWDWSAHRSAIAHHGRHFEVRSRRRDA